MKKRLITTLSISLLAATALNAGNITVHAVSQPAEQVFAQIMKQSGKNFIYSGDLLKRLKVSVNVKDGSLETTLDEMFRNTDIGYKIKGNNIMLFKTERPKVRKKDFTVSGFIREVGTGEALVGVSIFNPDLHNGTSSNVMGFYSLSIPEGKTSLSVTYPGFESKTISIDNLNANKTIDIDLTPDGKVLNEVEVHGSKNNTLAMESADIGHLNLSKSVIAATPVIFGESDVIKTLQLEPGVSAGVEGMAGMYVHGGNADENMFMLDNIPLYQVNHFGGLFSAFNVEALRNVDFYKSSFPAKYDGRLSSYTDVHTKDGSMSERHGSFKLGLTSGAFNIDGPICKDRTSYSVAVRRSWYDLLTLPGCAIGNSFSKEDKYNIGYAFTDLNAKITHRFSDRSRGYVMFYYGEDYLNYKVKEIYSGGAYDLDKNNLRWGNIVASAGWNYVLAPKLFGEFTAAYSRYFSRLHNSSKNVVAPSKGEMFTYSRLHSDNNINDWLLKADFDWYPHSSHHINFGVSYTLHNFLPFRDRQKVTTESSSVSIDERMTSYKAGELNAYAGGDWTISDNFRADYGLHYSLFSLDNQRHGNLSPRVSFRWSPIHDFAIKGGFSRSVQYVNQLYETSISLPTDQWVPIVDDQKPKTCDKIFCGFYYSPYTSLTVSVEGYYKWLKNLLDYRDEYYLLPPAEAWQQKLVTGKGWAKGIDFKIAKEFGKVNGHISYSLLWADRQFADKNGGKKFPARFDNRHKINILANWKINEKWELSAAWTGMSGNRVTLPTQMWEDPELAPWHYDMTLTTDVNNYRLPFYHRLDMSATRYTKRGFWTFSLYNAYCNLNTIGIQREYSDDWDFRPVFKKIKLIPIIPSVSYTWKF